MSERLAALVQTRPGNSMAIAAIDAASAPITANDQPNSDLGAHFYQVAKLMRANTPVRGNRPFFLCKWTASTRTPTRSAPARARVDMLQCCQSWAKPWWPSKRR